MISPHICYPFTHCKYLQYLFRFVLSAGNGQHSKNTIQFTATTIQIQYQHSTIK